MESSNMSAIREALGAINCINIEGLKRLLAGLVEADIFDGGHINRTIAAVERARRALSTLAAESAPVRNCDVGTVKEQTERFEDFCQSNMQFYRDMFGHDDEGRLDGWDCREDCPVGRMIDNGKAVADRCQLAWAQMPYNNEELNLPGFR